MGKRRCKGDPCTKEIYAHVILVNVGGQGMEYVSVFRSFLNKFSIYRFDDPLKAQQFMALDHDDEVRLSYEANGHPIVGSYRNARSARIDYMNGDFIKWDVVSP